MQLPFLSRLIRNTPPSELVERLLLTPFDELLIVNLKTGRYRFHFHNDVKLFAPVDKGTFEGLIRYTIDHLVHPDDRGLYTAFLDVRTMPARLAAASPEGVLSSEIRLLSMDGNWLTMQFLILSCTRFGLEEDCFYFYLYDIRELDQRLNGKQDTQSATDHLLGLMPDILTEEEFFAMAQERLPHLEGTWCMIAVDIKHFKLFKELNGQENGEMLLIRFAEILQAHAAFAGGLAGYRGQDDFGLLIPYEKSAVDKVFTELRRAIDFLSSSRGFFPAMGICLIDETGLNALELFNRAALTAEEIKDDLQSHIRIYDPVAHQRHVEEFRILSDFNTALQAGNITFYLQPQVDVASGLIVGAESLARWCRPDGHMIPPTVFVPVLEKYGIVTNLDTFIWDSVCRFLRGLLDRGVQPVPVSVNVSRVDIFSINVVQALLDLTEKYNLPHSLLEVEITESAYVDDSHPVHQAVADLRSHGFRVLMDDFGSGYSSLNMLRAVSMDIIKLDAQFLHFTVGDELKGISILESVVNMTRTLSVPLIVEGVESRELIDFLSDMNIRYMQGFYFYRPMPADRFEALISQPGKTSDAGIIFHGNDPLQVREFIDDSIYSDAMLNNILGPVAFYSLHDESIDIVRYNQQFMHLVGLPLDTLEIRKIGIEKFIHPEDIRPFLEMLEKSRVDRINGASGIFRIYLPNMSIFWMQIHVYFLRKEEAGASLFYASCHNVSEVMTARSRMLLMEKYSTDCVIFYRMKDGVLISDLAIYGLQDYLGMEEPDFRAALESGEVNRWIRREHSLVSDFIRNFEDPAVLNGVYTVSLPDGRSMPVHLRFSRVPEKNDIADCIVTIFAPSDRGRP